MKSIVHVNRHHIAANAKDGSDRPVYTIKQGRKTLYGRAVVFTGPSRAVYRPSKPLSCGAKAWIETDHPVEIVDQMTFEEAKKCFNQKDDAQ